MKKPTVEYHEAANIFPLDEEHLDELAQDIRKYGLKESIKLLDDKILDGRRRSLACEKAGVQARYEEVQTDDPIAYVVSVNLHRRHLTPSQRSMCAARAKELKEKYEKEAEERKREAGARGGRASGASRRGETKVPADRPEPSKAAPADVPEPIKGETRDQLGKVFDVGGRSVGRATKVLEAAEPEVAKAVDEGRLSVSAAEELADEEPEVQRETAEQAKFSGGRYRKPKPTPDPEEDDGEIKGVGVIRAHEAINCLTRIPKNDAQRKRGFQIVTDWIRHNR